MKQTALSTFQVTTLSIGILTLGLLSAQAQDCRLQVRFSGLTQFKYYTVLKISFAATTNSCAGVRAAVEWSDDLVTWYPLHQTGFPCVTQGTEMQVIDE